jgi:Flp pilus assembly protein TadD
LAKRKKARKNGGPGAWRAGVENSKDSGSIRPGRRSWLAVIGAACAIAAVLILIGYLVVRSRNGGAMHEGAARSDKKIQFVGAEVCGSCHQQEFKLWTGSHHQLAMQPANPATVLGDFNGATLTQGGVTSRFFRRGGQFFVNTDGPDGAPHDYRIAYTFGVAPLQQYLISLPGGRLQAFGVAWDSRPRTQGGQRWFHLYADQQISPANPLHWTGPDQNWNFMCADCHSTNVRKNYDLPTRTYATTYAEIDVACEACHGPGSAHVAWAHRHGSWYSSANNRGLLIALDERRNIVWRIDPATGNARRSRPRMSSREIQMCARCHSRRSQIHEDFVHGQPLGDDYRVSLLDPDLYYPDGQIKAEDYEYGSFIQSRMFHAGVTCSDCHEPHSLKLRAQGNNLCSRCHAAARYDSAAHHFHKAGAPGAHCVDCHMPATLYMVVDARRDHSIRIPRPDLSVTLGVPNACNQCHSDKSAHWAAETVRKWYGHTLSGFQNFAAALKAGSLGAPGAETSLVQLIDDRNQPAIVRASALVRLGSAGIPVLRAIRKGATDGNALVRRAAARAMADADPGISVPILLPLLSDPVRAVRIETAEVLAGAPSDLLAPVGQAMLGRAVGEYLSAQELNADRPEAHLNMALVFARERQFDRAERELRDALALEPSFAPAAVNLADLYRELGRDKEGERVLRGAIAHAPGNAALENALGLLLIRQGHKREALGHLAAAAKLDPSDGRIGYVYAIALDDAGQTDAAIQVLSAELERHPFDREALAALTNLYDKSGNPRQALLYAKRLARLDPDDAQVRQLLDQLEREAQPSSDDQQSPAGR